MRFALVFLISFGVLGEAHAHSLDTCVARLSPQKTKEIFLNEAGGWQLSRLKTTPLEVSAYLRSWKTELARKLELAPENISGTFRRGTAGFEEISRPTAGEARLLLVRTRSGLRGIVVFKAELERERLTYIDPVFPRLQTSSIFAATDDGRPSLHIPAFEDSFDRGGVTGNVAGIITLKVPGLFF